MKIKFNKTSLKKSLTIINKGVSTKSPLEITEFILISAEKNDILLYSFDNLIQISQKVEGEIIESGEICIKERIFSEITNKMPSEEILLEVIDNRAVITSGEVKYEIEYKNKEEFPQKDFIDDIGSIIIKNSEFKEIIKKTTFSTNQMSLNEVMSGECLNINKNNLCITAIDGNRLARINKKIESNINEEIIIPASTMNKINSILEEDEEKLNINITNNKIYLNSNDTRISCSLIEGDYINTDRIINNDYETKIKINKKELLESIERSTVISILSREGRNIPIIMNIKENIIELKIESGNNSWKESINCEVEGENIEIGFNPKYFIDALRVIEDEEIEIFFKNPRAAAFIKDKQENYIYLIMPQNI